MECAARGRSGRCVGPATRRCARCGAVAYCSVSHQISHWSVHKDECERLEQQMDRANVLNDFPFTFSQESTVQVCEKQETRCSFLIKQGIHRVGMWICECHCGESVASSNHSRDSFLLSFGGTGPSGLIESWNLPSILCPCKGPSSRLTKQLNSWGDYYEWRGIPLQSPAALLLQWPLTLYQAFQLSASRSWTFETYTQLHVHYLGPDKELTQLAVFGELQALFPEVQLHVQLVGPAVPQCRDGERVDLHGYARCGDTDCSCKSSSDNLSLRVCNITPPVTLRLYKGYYHDRYRDMAKDFLPHLVIAPNAGIAAYKSWLPSIELIKEKNIPAVFTDYCEEASHLAASCISSITGHPLSIPIQLNPFRQPMAVEESALNLPCFSNCFLFGM